MWFDLVVISYQMSEPWLIMGDFNVVTSQLERVNSVLAPQEAIDEFLECLSQYGLNEMPVTGARYTWWNNQEGGEVVWSRLDRILCSAQWLNSVPNADGHVGPMGVLDHCTLQVTINNVDAMRRAPFKYLNAWSEHPSFLQLVQHCWEQDISGSPMYVIVTKLKALKQALRKLHRGHYLKISEEVHEAYKMLVTCQDQLHQDPCNRELQREEKQYLRAYQRLRRTEEGILAQRAKHDFIQLGDL